MLQDLDRTIVRDPYARAMSMYVFEVYQCSIGNKREHPGGAAAFFSEWGLSSFDTFLDRILWNREHIDAPFPSHYPNFLPCWLWLDPVQPVKILHLENVQAEWNAQPELPSVILPHARRQKYSKTLTASQIAKINGWAREDFDAFGYERRG